jgi:hypothetical protein
LLVIVLILLLNRLSWFQLMSMRKTPCLSSQLDVDLLPKLLLLLFRFMLPQLLLQLPSLVAFRSPAHRRPRGPQRPCPAPLVAPRTG